MAAMVGLGAILRRAATVGRALWRDEAGAILVYVTVGATVFFGLAALVIDGGRIFVLHSQLQDAADAAALAGAAELDRHPDALTRATRAINNTGSLVTTNGQTFATGSSPISIASITFLQSLPASDSSAITNTNITTSASLARFVRVITQTRSTTNFFARLIGGSSTQSTSASAVAGLDSTACNITPMFICDPYNNAAGTNSLIDLLNNTTTVTNNGVTKTTGDWVRARSMILTCPTNNGNCGGNASYAPGNFGLLQAVNGNGAQGVRDAFANVNPGKCYLQTNVKTGSQPGPVADGVNTRFDIYGGPEPASASNPPALNVTKGYYLPNGSNWCNNARANDGTGGGNPPAANTVAMPLVPDSCLSGTCTVANPTPAGNLAGRVGDGSWDFAGYWAMNHGSYAKPNDPVTTKVWGSGACVAANTCTLPTRYQVYQWELTTPKIPNHLLDGAPTAENGNPQCNMNPLPANTPDRRTLVVAVFNCNDPTIAAELNGASGNPTAEGFVKVFMTQPASSTGQITVYSEIIDVATTGNGGGAIKDVVQLYR